jgi:hypothetical protein
MVSIATMRRLGPWLVGLYVLALVGGVIPLINEHSAHAGGPLMLSEFRGGIGAVPQDHHHAGDSDDAARHHALQDLNGVPTWLADRDEIAVVHIAFTSAASRALAEADGILLERPPRPFRSI